MDTSNVVPMRRRAQPDGSEASFLCCPVCGGTEFAVVCRFNDGSPFIVVLVCAGCRGASEIGVTEGVLA